MSTSSWGSGSEPSKPYRRRKKHEGATWTPPNASALKEDGVWCPHHRMRHGYKSDQLGFSPERWNGKSYIHWYCKKTGDVLETVELGHGSVAPVRVHPGGDDGGNTGDPLVDGDQAGEQAAPKEEG